MRNKILTTKQNQLLVRWLLSLVPVQHHIQVQLDLGRRTHTHIQTLFLLLIIDAGEVKDVYTGAEVKRLLIIDAGEVKDVYTGAEVKRLLIIDAGEVKDVYTGAEVKRLLIIDAGEVKDVYTGAEVKRN